MSSPPRQRVTFSPIKNIIDDRYSPSRNLDTILQESKSSKRSVRQDIGRNQSKDLGGNQSNYRSKFSIPTPTYRGYSDNLGFNESRRLMVENERLQNDNKILASSRNYQSITYGKQLQVRESQVQILQRQLGLVSDRYEKQLQMLTFQNESLKRKLVLLENQKFQQIAILKQRYTGLPEEMQDQFRKTYENDITKALMQVQNVHLILSEKERQLQHLTHMCRQNSAEYGVNLEDLVSENNILRNKLMQFQVSAEKQMREMTAKKELEKSRTQGIMSHCKENTLYIEKEISRLADQLLKKNISNQSFTRQLTKYQRLIEDQTKRHDDTIYRLRKDHEETLADKENSFARYQKKFKLDLAEKKRLQLQLIDKISSMENQLSTLQKQLQYSYQNLQDKENYIRELKESLSRKEEQHVKEISKVMSTSRIGRKSMKNISSLGSIKDIDQPQGSSIIRSGHIRQQSGHIRQQSGLQQLGQSPLPVVREQSNLARSQAYNMEEEDNYDMKQIVIHYQSLMQQLKRNKLTQLSIANNKIESLKQSLNQKQQEILDLLNRFSPLMEYKVNREDIDAERKRRIEEHQKADIDLLDVMLSKYDIVALRRK